MRKLSIIICALFILIQANHQISANTIEVEDIKIAESKYREQSQFQKEPPISLIMEVEGSPAEHKVYIEKNYPEIEVVQTYTLLFQGLAIKGPKLKVDKVTHLDFVRGFHPVHTYETKYNQSTMQDIQSNEELKTSQYTGKGVKVAVIDTGIDYSHPDLIKNYKSGFDLVDLDDDPMETTPDEGTATLHGTHVAGIIAANGELQGIAPDAEIYAYRALGPGGMGNSINVIAAMEQAVRDEVDIINLSLGNTVNGPDYPTSKAVDAASKYGIAVVVANGNDGPEDWTVGSPATAQSAFSVGAYESAGEKVYLYDAESNRQINLIQLNNAKQWALTRDYQVVSNNTQGKIRLIKAENEPIADLLHKAEADGAAAVLLYKTGTDNTWQIGLSEAEFNLPVALISLEDGKWLAQNQHTYLETKSELIVEQVTDFSSRGPVTMNWTIKPDILAPGANIVSTVPGGYQRLSGTSMATPYIAGIIALTKEAKPDWSNEQIFGAIKTTARKLQTHKNKLVAPTMQGSGLVDVKKAINTETIITNSDLNFGKINAWLETSVVQVEIENLSNQSQQYNFVIPNKQKGIAWSLPQSFTVEANTKMQIEIELKINSSLLDEGINQGWLELINDDTVFQLPYLFVNQTSTYPKIMGFDFRLNHYNQDTYSYQFYIPEKVKYVQIQLYDPTLLVYEGLLYKWRDLQVGMNEGEINLRKIEQQGYFHAVIIVQLENGEYVNYETEVYLE